MKTGEYVLAGILILAGMIWFLQGINLLPGSFMTGEAHGQSMAESHLSRA